MEENLEIEFKILIDKNTYQQILNDYPSDCSYQQINYYLTHPKLSKLKYMLRIRQKQANYELTLKQPQIHGNLETNLIIDEITKDKILNQQLINNEVFDLLAPYQLDSTMFNTDYSLITNRHEMTTPGGLICLDENHYNNLTDYELEYEVTDYHLGKAAFLELIKKYNLNYINNCPSKVHRLLKSIKDGI